MEIDVLSQSEVNEEKKREKEVRGVQKNLPTVKEETITAPEPMKPGKRLDALMESTNIDAPKEDNNLSVSNEDVVTDYEDAQLMMPFEDTTDINPKTGKTVMEELYGIQDNIIMNYQSRMPEKKESGWLKEAASGLLESGVNGAKLPAQLSVWGGMLASKAGADTLGRQMIEWGNEKINNIDYFLNEINPNVDRGTLTYNLSSAIGDVFTAFGLGKVVRASSNLIKMSEADEVAYSLGLRGLNIAGDSKLASAAKKLTGGAKYGLGKLGEITPFMYMMSKDMGGFTEERIKQYNDNFGRIDWERLTPENITDELLATSIYGAGATWMEKKLGLGIIMKSAPKGAEVSLNAIRNYVLKGGEYVNTLAGKHTILTYLGLSTASEAFTEASQELWQVANEAFFKLPEKYHKDGKEVFEYRQKEFAETLQRIATSALIGGTIGGASSAILVQRAKNDFVNTASPVLEEVYTTSGRDGKVLSAEDAKMYAHNDSAQMFYKYYGTSASILAKEMETQDSMAMESGAAFTALYQKLDADLSLFMIEHPEVKVADKELEVTNASRNMAYALTHLLAAKGVSIQNWTNDLDVEFSKTDSGLLTLNVKWQGRPIFSSASGMNTNTYYQQLTEEERASMENWEEVPVEKVDEETYEVQDQTTQEPSQPQQVKVSLVFNKPNGEAYTLVNKETGNVVTNVEEINNYNKAAERLAQIEEDAIKATTLRDNQAGAFNTSLGTIFINPKASNPTTLLHEFGHLYFENLFVTLKNSESFRSTPLGEAATALFREMGVRPGQPRLTTSQSELLADMMSANLTGSVVEGLTRKGVQHRNIVKYLRAIKDDAKRRVVKGFSKYNNNRFVSISPSAKEVLENIFDMPVKTKVDEKGLYNKFHDIASKASTKLPEESLDRIAKSVAGKDTTSLYGQEKALAEDIMVEDMAKSKDAEGIKEYFRKNIAWDINSLDLSTTRGQLNRFYVNNINAIAAREGLSPQEVLANDMLYQTISPFKEEVEGVDSSVSKGTAEDVEKLGVLGILTRLRYASMLGTVSTASLTGFSDTFNMIYANLSNSLTGKWKGVQNTVSGLVHNSIKERAVRTFLDTLSSNQFAFETADQYNKKVQQARATTGNKVLDKVAIGLQWGSVAPTGGIDFLIKTPYGIRQGEMMASKLAQTSNMTADEIMLDAENFVPATEEGRKVREEVQNAMREIEFMSEPSPDAKDIGTKITKGFTKGLDAILGEMISDTEWRGLVRSAILPFNSIATGQAARVVNALALLPAGFFGGINAIYQSKVNGDGEAFVKYAEGMKPYLKDGIYTAILAALLSSLLDDDDIMPSYENATDKQRKISKNLNIPYNSVKIGNTWVSIEYAGVLKSAFYMIPSIKELFKGNLVESAKAYRNGVISALAESPAVELVTKGIRESLEEQDITKGVESYLSSYWPRMVTSVQQLDGKTNYYSPLTGDNTLTPANNAYRFVFGSRVREGTIEQTNALIAARRGVNLVQTIKSTEKYKELSADKKKEAEKVFASTYHQLIESYLSRGLPAGDDAETIKKIVRKLASRAREETFKRIDVK